MKKASRQQNTNDTHIRFAVLAADLALFSIREGKLVVRVAKVFRPPYFSNMWGLPGGLIDPRETAEESVLRHAKDKARISSSDVYIEQLFTFSALARDPRGRVVSVGYIGLVPWDTLTEAEKEQTDTHAWVGVGETGKLAYDHDEILLVALERLRSRVAYTSLIARLMPKEFTLTELEESFEILVGHKIDKRNFRKKILKTKILKKLGKKKQGMKWRPAELYAFKSTKVTQIEVL